PAWQEALGAQGIQTAIHYPTPVHLLPAFADLGYRRNQFPHAERAAREVLSLPMYAELTPQQGETVGRAVCGLARDLPGSAVGRWHVTQRCGAKRDRSSSSRATATASKRWIASATPIAVSGSSTTPLRSSGPARTATGSWGEPPSRNGATRSCWHFPGAPRHT